MNRLQIGQFAQLERGEALAMASMHPGGIEATRRLIRWCGIRQGTQVLDLGCGVGQTACLLFQRCRASVVGIDKSPRMISRARERAGLTLKDATAVLFMEGDAYDLPFDSEVFEVVLTESVTLFLDRQKVLREAFRVLQPGGRIADIVMTCQNPQSPEVQAVLEKLARFDGGRMNPISPEDWVKAYEQAGFRIRKTEFHSSISDGATVFSFFRDHGWGGLRFLMRLWFSDRAYGRGLKALWRKEKHRFGFGLIVAERP